VTNTPNTFLCTDKTYGDFIFEYEFKVDPRLNSGVQIRSLAYDQATEFVGEGKPIKIPAGRVHGYQIEIDPDVKKRMWSGGIYDEARRGWLFPRGGEKAPRPRSSASKGCAFSSPTIGTQSGWKPVGDSIKTWLNGTPCADLKDSVTARGFIALQVHGIAQGRTRTAPRCAGGI
jgi:hypothetical protein